MEAHYLKNPPDRTIREVYALDEYGVGYYAPHYHEHAEIMYVVEGTVRVILDYKEYFFSKGDILVIFPNQIHCLSEPYGNVHTYIFIFKDSVCTGYRKLLEAKRPDDPIIQGAALIPGVMNLIQLIMDESLNEDLYSERIMSGFVQALLGILFRKCTLVNRGNLDETTSMRILAYCHEHFKEDISLTSAAEALDLNPYYLSHLVPQKYGMHFGELISVLRLDEVVRLIKEGQKISTAAMNSGFSNVRAFNRAFLKHYGSSPTEYFRRKGKSEDGLDI